MLELPKQSDRWWSGAIVLQLLKRVRSRRLRIELTRHMIGASLDLMVATWPRRDRPPLVVETLPNMTWRVNRLHYVFVGTADKDSIKYCASLACSFDTIAITYSDQWENLRLQMRAIVKDRYPPINTLDGFMSWRT